MAAQFDTIGVDIDGFIARIEFRRPDQLNAFDAVMHREFGEALALVRAMTDIRAILIQAQGRAFSAGGDFDYIRQVSSDRAFGQTTQREGQDLFSLLNDMPVPVIAAMQGHAMGLGATIVTSCDMIVAWAHAKLGDPHVRVGLTAGDGGVLSWSAAAGVNRAKRMLLTGDAITAREAYAFGLVTDLVDTPEEVLPAAEALAARIAALPPMAVQGTKRIFNALERQRNAGLMHVSLLTEVATMNSDDLDEALRAAAEKRPGVYRNR